MVRVLALKRHDDIQVRNKRYVVEGTLSDTQARTEMHDSEIIHVLAERANKIESDVFL